MNNAIVNLILYFITYNKELEVIVSLIFYFITYFLPFIFHFFAYFQMLISKIIPIKAIASAQLKYISKKQKKMK